MLAYTREMWSHQRRVYIIRNDDFIFIPVLHIRLLESAFAVSFFSESWLYVRIYSWEYVSAYATTPKFEPSVCVYA